MNLDLFSHKERIGLNEKWDANTQKEGKKVGIRELDAVFRPDNGTMVLTAGYSMGKTTFANFYMFMDAVTNNNKSLIYEYEGNTSERFFIYRTLFSNYNKMTKSNLSDEEYFIVGKPRKKTVEQLLEEIRCIKERYNIKNVLIDPFTNLINRMGGGKNTDKIGDVMETLNQFAEENDILFILGCHQKNVVDANGNRIKLSLENNYGGGNIAYAADYVLGLEREGNDSNLTHFEVLKSRSVLKAKMFAEFTLRYVSPLMYYVGADDAPFNQVDRGGELKRDIECVKTTLNDATEKFRIPKDVLSTSISIYDTSRPLANGGSQYVCDITIGQFNDYSKRLCQKLIDQLRATDYHSDDYKRLKRRIGQMATFSGTFHGATKKNNEIVTYSHIYMTDIDLTDNPQYEGNLEQLKKDVNSIPYVFYSMASVGGKGLLALIYFGRGKEQYEKQFNAIYQVFAYRDIIIDTQCKDLSRGKYLSYDDSPYFNAEARIFNDMTDIKPNEQRALKSAGNGLKSNPTQTDTDEDVPTIIKRLEVYTQEAERNKVNLLGLEESWWKSAFGLAKTLGEQGRAYFHRLSSLDEQKYNKAENDRMYDRAIADCEKYGFTIKYLFWVFKNNGINFTING